MLILARRNDESLIITTPNGEEIQIILMNAHRGSAQLGIQAPPDYIITRDELIKKQPVIVRG